MLWLVSTIRRRFLAPLMGCAGFALVAWSMIDGSGWLPLVLLALWLSGIVVLATRGQVRVLGPLLYYDMVRMARRRQTILLRCAYTLVLGAVFFFVYSTWFYNRTDDPWSVFGGQTLRARDLPGLVSAFFSSFMAVQVLLVFLLTPPYVASALAEEKERGTLEYYLATDLEDREIVLSLALSRLAALVLVVATGLPILAIMQLLGGMDPQLVLAGFVATGITMVSLGSVGVLCSVYARRPREAIVHTYVIVLFYLILSGASLFLLIPTGWGTYPSTATWVSPVTLEDVVWWLNAGNLIAQVGKLVREVEVGKSIDLLLPEVLRTYVLFHGAVALGCVVWAVRRMRPVALGQVEKSLPRLRKGEEELCWPVGSWPMFWKEILARGRQRSFAQKVGRWILLLGTFAPALCIPFAVFSLNLWNWERQMVQAFNVWARGASGVIGTLALMGVGIHAAGRVSGERDRLTLDGLLSTNLDSTAILFAKWLGSVVSSWRALLILAVVGGVGIVTGGVAPSAMILFLVVWLVFASFMASLGIWFSVVSRTTTRATLWTLISITALSGGHWLLWIFLVPLFNLIVGTSAAVDGLTQLEAYGLTPPITLGALVYSDVDNRGINSETPSILLGQIMWALGAVLFWIMASTRFRKVANRSFALAGKTRQGVGVVNWSVEGSGANRSPVPTARAGSRRRITFSFQGFVPGRYSLPDREMLFRTCRTLAMRWTRRVALVAGLVLSCWGAWFVWSTIEERAGDRALLEARAEADRLDPGWREPEKFQDLPKIPKDRNAALRVEEVAKLLPINWPLSQATIDSCAEGPFGGDQRLRLIQMELDRAGGSLKLALTLAELPAARSPRGRGSSQNPWSQQIVDATRVIRLLDYELTRQVPQGSEDQILRTCLALHNTANSFGDTRNFYQHLHQVDCQSFVRERFIQILNHRVVSHDFLVKLQKGTEKETPFFLVTVLRRERAELEQKSLARKSAMDIELHYWRFFRPTFLQRSGWWRFLLPGETKKQNASVLHFMNQVVEAAKLPTKDQAAVFSKLETEVADLPHLVGLTVPVVPVGLEKITQEQAERRCVATVLAVERYRLAHGRWPGALSDLVPEQIPAVPRDPFDGKPLRFRINRKGIIVYSVGPDGADNAGIAATNVSNLNNFYYGPRYPAGTDIVYRLCNPILRGKSKSQQGNNEDEEKTP